MTGLQYHRSLDLDRGNHVARPPVSIAPATGPMTLLAGRKVLVLLDAENLTIGARKLGYEVDYGRLAGILHSASRTASLHAFFSREPGDQESVDFIRQRGWVAHSREIETIRTSTGVQRLANADSLIMFTAGVLASHSDAEVVCLATGDGTLGCELAAFLVGLPKQSRRVATLSLAGATSWRLHARRNAAIAVNIEVGLDVLRPHPRGVHS